MLRKGETSLGTSFESYFPLKEIRLSDGPFLDLQQKGKEMAEEFLKLSQEIEFKPDIMDVTMKELFNFPAGIDVVHIGIENDLEHHPGMVRCV